MYPDDSIQHYLDRWWVGDDTRELQRGRLVKAFVPFIGMELRRLVLQGRPEARVLDRALFKVEPFAMGTPHPPAQLPVPAMPRARGEDFLAIKGKYRPALIVSAGGPELPGELRRGAPRRHTATTLLLAPYFTADQNGTRAGYRPEFVDRVRRGEYPHFCWDKLPLGGAGESLLRLDYLFPVPKERTAVELLPHRLAPEGLAILDDWLTWLFTGQLDGDSELAFLREGLPAGA